MRIYNYTLRINPEAKHAFSEEIVDGAEETRDGWIVSRGTWDTTHFYAKPQSSNAMYLPIVTFASPTPVPDAKQKLCKFMEEQLTEQLMRQVEDTQKMIAWLREEAER